VLILLILLIHTRLWYVSTTSTTIALFPKLTLKRQFSIELEVKNEIFKFKTFSGVMGDGEGII